MFESFLMSSFGDLRCEIGRDSIEKFKLKSFSLIAHAKYCWAKRWKASKTVFQKGTLMSLVELLMILNYF